jgi:hypothetical protein
MFVSLAVAIAVIVPWQRDLSWMSLAVLAGCYTLARRVVFPVGTIWADSTQIIFVPMLFLLPAPIIAAVVGGCCLLSRLRVDRRGVRAISPPPLLGTLGDCLYVFPPVIVFATFGLSDPSRADVASLPAEDEQTDADVPRISVGIG